MHRRVALCLAALLATAALTACGAPSKDDIAASTEIRAAIITADAAFKETVLFADPEGAVEAIYGSLEGTPLISSVEKGALEDAFGISEDDVVSFVAYISDAKNGLCDVAIIEPKEGKMEDVRESLMRYRTQRAEQFKNFDILNSYAIASGAAVLSQGDYVIMLMLPDNEAAQEILDKYLPPV